MKIKYLREVDVVASHLKTECKQFLEESRCVLYLLSELVDKKVQCDFKKIGIKIWPKDSVPKSSGNSFIVDSQSSVLILDIGYDIDNYNKLTKLVDRNIELVRIIKSTVRLIDKSINFDTEEFFSILESIERKGFIFEKEHGVWKHNKSKSASIKLYTKYDYSGIEFGVKVRNSNNEYEKVFANYGPFEASTLYELGRVDFRDNENAIYMPKGFYEPINFNLKR